MAFQVLSHYRIVADISSFFFLLSPFPFVGTCIMHHGLWVAWKGNMQDINRESGILLLVYLYSESQPSYKQHSSFCKLLPPCREMRSKFPGNRGS